MAALSWLFFEVIAAALLLLPGALVARRFPLLWSRISPGERILPSLLLSIGIAGVAYVVASRLDPTVDGLVGAWAVLVLALLAWNVAVEIVTRRQARRDRSGLEPFSSGSGRSPSPDLPAPVGRAAARGALGLSLLGFVVMSYSGGALGVLHDSLEFVAFVQRMLLTGRIDLVSGAFRDVADLGPDPRRGVFHFFAVILCRLSGASAVEMWRWLPAVLVPIAFWSFFVAMRRVLQSATVALVSLVLLAVVLLSSNQAYLNNLAYASRIGWVYSWVGLWATALACDARASRAAGGTSDRAAVALAIVAAPILLGVHVYSAAQYLVALGACAWSWAALKPLDRPTRRMLLLLPLSAVAAALPVLAVKIHQSYASANGLFDHAQGLLYVAGDWAVLSPHYLKPWFGWGGFLALFLVIPLAWGFRRRRDQAYLVGSTLAVALIVLNPLAVRLVERAGAHSVLFRILLAAPWFQLLAWCLVWCWRAPRSPRRSGLFRAAGALLILAAVGWQVRGEWKQGGGVHRSSRDWAEFPAVQAALRAIDREEPGPVVVVSDPLTSYLIPGFSRNFAIAPFGQHSSPADGRTIERIQDARAVLNPLVGASETVRLLRKYQARYVLLNQTVRSARPFYYAPIDPGVYAGQEDKFAARSDLFHSVYARDAVRVFRFEDPGPAWSDPSPQSNPHRLLSADEARGAGRNELAERCGVQPWSGPVVGGLELIGVRVDSAATVRPGDALTIDSYWRRTGEPYVLPVAVFARMQTTYPDRRFESPVFGRLFRAWYESRHWVSHRFGRELEPLGAEYPAFLWEPGAVYRAPLRLPVLINAKPGEYSLGLLVRTVPFEPNLRLTDLFTLDDSQEGTKVATVRVSSDSACR